MVETEPVLLILCAIVAFLACSTRFYFRVIIGRRFEVLEFVLVLALLMQIILVSLQLRMFTLLPSIQNPLNLIQIQKLFFAGTFFYFASLWSVKISINLLHIQLTRRFQRIRFLAVCTLYTLLGALPFIYVVYLAACWPVSRRWALPSGRQCSPMVHAWDFWTHFSIHLITDIILCILPFPALLKVTETRLRVAVCGVYSLTIIAIIVTIIRVVLLATDVQNSIKRIIVLTTVELTVCIVIGILPGVSSSFTRKYAQGVSGFSKPGPSSNGRSAKHDKRNFSHISSDRELFEMRAGKDVDAVSVPRTSHQVIVFAEERDESSSFAGSTERIIDTAKGGITKVVDISIAVQKG